MLSEILAFSLQDVQLAVMRAHMTATPAQLPALTASVAMLMMEVKDAQVNMLLHLIMIVLYFT